MLTVTVDVRKALAQLQAVRQDQSPYATSRAINACAYESRAALLTKIQSIYRFKSGAGWTRGGGALGTGWFHVSPSDKRQARIEASVSVDPQYYYAYLYKESALGGIKIARRRYLAVPLGNLQQHRIPADLSPRALMAPGGSGFIISTGTSKFIAIRSGKKTGVTGLPATSARLKGIVLLYSLLPLVKVKGQKIIDMEATVRATVAKTFPEAFRREMELAIRTAR
jgi:hypothetical protein